MAKKTAEEIKTALLAEMAMGYHTSTVKLAANAGVDYKTACKYRDELVNSNRVRVASCDGCQLAYADNAKVKFDLAGVNQKIIMADDKVFHLDFVIEQQVPIIDVHSSTNDTWLTQTVTLSIPYDLLKKMVEIAESEVPFF